MIFSINNIGIIKNAQVKVDGLTVISGANNSGKTTVGKALYSVSSATEDLAKNQERDRGIALCNRLHEMMRPYELLMEIYDEICWNRDYMAQHEEDIALQINMLRMFGYGEDREWIYYVDLLNRFYQSIKNDEFYDCVIQDVKSIKQMPEELLHEVAEEWESNKPYTLKQCELALEFVNSVPSKEEFALKMIDGVLKEEFSGQVQSMTLRNEVEESSYLKLYNGKKEYFNICLKNHTVDIKSSRFDESYFKQGYFVDDPYIIEDKVNRSDTVYRRTKKKSYFKSTIIPHRDKMNLWMKKNIEVERGISETLYREKQIADVMEKINSIVPGDIVGDTYINAGRKLKVTNLATGFKVFSIIKNILEKGNIDEQSLLVLDEPESHLHPKWINALAEVLVLLVKECNITVLLTTHSPNFLLAIDALMRKYDIREKCHFYQTETIENDFRVNYVEKTDELDDVYAEYAKAFSEMNALRKKYMGLGGD